MRTVVVAAFRKGCVYHQGVPFKKLCMKMSKKEGTSNCVTVHEMCIIREVSHQGVQFKKVFHGGGMRSLVDVVDVFDVVDVVTSLTSLTLLTT